MVVDALGTNWASRPVPQSYVAGAADAGEMAATEVPLYGVLRDADGRPYTLGLGLSLRPGLSDAYDLGTTDVDGAVATFEVLPGDAVEQAPRAAVPSDRGSAAGRGRPSGGTAETVRAAASALRSTLRSARNVAGRGDLPVQRALVSPAAIDLSTLVALFSGGRGVGTVRGGSVAALVGPAGGRAPSFAGAFPGSFGSVPAFSLRDDPFMSTGVLGYSTVAVVPEPGTLGLLAVGGALVGAASRRRRRQHRRVD